MSGDAIADIKARLDLVDVIGAYVSLRRRGREHLGICPFHSEKTPSFSVSGEKQVWVCRGCGRGGDVLTFVQDIEHVGFREALELLAERAGVELEPSRADGSARRGARRRMVLDLNRRAAAYFEHVLWETQAGATGRALLDDRGVARELAQRFGVGFAPSGGVQGDALTRYLAVRAGVSVSDTVESGLAVPHRGGARDRFRHRLVFPIRDERGQVVAFGGRAMGDALPKYLNSPETAAYRKSLSLFGIDQAREAMARHGSAVVVEGYFDVLACHAAGIEHVVASSGTALTSDQIRTIARHVTTIVLCLDQDRAGLAAASRAVDLIAAEGLTARIAVLPDGVKDPDELRRVNPSRLVSVVADAAPEWRVLLDQALDHGEGGRVEDRRLAAERATAVLSRIPEGATRDLYLQQAARRLELSVASLRGDVRRRLGQQRTAVPLRVSAPANPVASDGVEEEAVATPMSAWERHIGSLVVQRPQLATRLVHVHGLDPAQLRDERVRRLLQLAANVPDGEPFPLHRLGRTDQRCAADLLLRRLPELGDGVPDEVRDQAAADCVRRVREAAIVHSIEETERAMQAAREAGRDDEADALAATLRDLATQAPTLRRSVRRI